MSNTKQEDIPSVRPIYFKPDVLARIAPDVSLQKHLNIGLRPSLRKFQEFKTVSVSKAGLSRYESTDKDSEEPSFKGDLIGSSVVKSGSTVVMCGISAGIIEDTDAFINDYRVKLDNDIIDVQELSSVEDPMSAKTSVYTVVEISKGRTGPPTQEETFISQKLFENLHHSGILSSESLKIKLGLKSYDENGESVVLYAGDNEDEVNMFKPKKNYSFILYANIIVLSRTGPVFDLCWGALLSALKNTYLPQVYINEKKTDIGVPIRSKSGQQHAVTESDYDLVCDAKVKFPLQIDDSKISWSSTFGIIEVNHEFKPADDEIETTEDDMDVDKDVEDGKSLLLADLEGESEEEIRKRINVTINKEGKLTSFSLTSGGSQRIDKQLILEAIDLSAKRSKDMLKKF